MRRGEIRRVTVSDLHGACPPPFVESGALQARPILRTGAGTRRGDLTPSRGEFLHVASTRGDATSTLGAMRVGILTAGGDCPGLNAVIRAAARRLMAHGHEAIGLRRGYRGLAEHDWVTLDQRSVSGILHLGGTILLTSNYNPFREPEGVAKVLSQQAQD